MGVPEPSFQAEFCSSVAQIPAAVWDGLTQQGGPLMSHSFFSTLEEVGVVSADTGWQPMHLLLRDGEGEPVALMPLYLKEHSQGEFIFDWSWADAWHRLGIPYYPKLVSAVPISPVEGPRLCIALSTDVESVRRAVLKAIARLAEDNGISGWHILFAGTQEADGWQQQGLSLRYGCNFRWYNRGYENYEEFLATMTARARKSLRRERRKVKEQGLVVRRLSGGEISEDDLRAMYLFYRQTCLSRGQSGYMNEDFFVRLREVMPDNLLLIQAKLAGQAVAAAFCLHDNSCLYGRYWGCAMPYDSLHFEVCYHQGVEFCIERKLAQYDPGVQGEHKVRRGFIPVLTCSAHWLAEPRLKPAVDDFCRREHEAVKNYRLACRQLLPFQAAREDLQRPPA